MTNKRKMIGVYKTDLGPSSESAAAQKWQYVGAIILSEPGKVGGFRYADNYVGPPIAPNLDFKDSGSRWFPITTIAPSEARKFMLSDLHSVFEQALPGEWGAKVITANASVYEKASPEGKLWMLGNRQAGGLYFMPHGPDIVVSPAIEGEDEIIKAEMQVQRFIAKHVPQLVGRTDPRLWAFTNAGGQQPKASYQEQNAQGEKVQYLAKFNEQKSYFGSGTRVERSLLQASEIAGISTVKSKLITDAAILCTERFDVREGSAVHKINMGTMLESPVTANLDYTDIAKAIRQHSNKPAEDLRSLYARMMFRAFSNDTDDHLGQFEMTLEENGKWRLTPNFDLNIDDKVHADGTASRKHSITMAGHSEVQFDSAFVAKTAEAFKLPKQEAFEITARVLNSIERLPALMTENGVSVKVRNALVEVLRLDEVKELKAVLNRRVMAMQDTDGQRSSM